MAVLPEGLIFGSSVAPRGHAGLGVTQGTTAAAALAARQHGARESGFLQRPGTKPSLLLRKGQSPRTARTCVSPAQAGILFPPCLLLTTSARPLCTIKSSRQLISHQVRSSVFPDCLHLHEHLTTDSHRHLLTFTLCWVHPKTNSKWNTKRNAANFCFPQKAKFTPKFFFNKSSPCKWIYFFSTHNRTYSPLG